MKKYSFLLLAILLLLTQSCEEFLEEEYLSGENTGTIITNERNMEALVVSSYTTLRLWYGKENGWDLTESGTDLYTWGLDNRSAGFCTYDSWVGEEDDRLAAMFYELYKGVNAINLALSGIDDVEYANESVRLNRKGELLYLRAYYNWQITEIWGDMPYKEEPYLDAEYNAVNTPVETRYEYIFKDLNAAVLLVPEATTEFGRITKPVVQGFLARLHLTWASYLENGLTLEGKEFIATNTALATTHYTQAQGYADTLINNYGFALVDDWSDLWTIGNELNSEIIWSVVYSDDPTYTSPFILNPWDSDYDDANDPASDKVYSSDHIILRDGGNNGHVMWEVRYENLGWGMERDIENGRGFQRWMPTKFFIDLYDQNADQRFNGSFKNVWLANSPAAIPKWRPFIYIDGVKTDVASELWAQPMFAEGDTAILFSKEPIPTAEKATASASSTDYFHPTKGYRIIDINDMYNADGSPNSAINRQYYFPITKKYEDPNRLTIPQQYGERDFFVMRISEMYLIAAEAAMKTNKPAESYAYLETLNNARAIDGNGAALLSGYGVASGADIDIDVILDERARELATENFRFFDLKRTDKLVERVKAYNTDAGPNIKEFHKLRFIPQEQLDAIRNTDEFLQNPGYN